MIQKIKYGNSIIQYDLIKSKRRKTSQITVTTQGVTVRTPHTKTTEDVKKCCKKEFNGFLKKQLHFAKQKKPAFSTKSTLSVLGKDYKIQIIPISTEKPDDHIATLVMFSLDGKHPCQKHMTIKDGLCVPESPRPLDFRDTGESTGLLYAYSGLSLVGIVIGFFVVKRWKNRK